MRFLFRRIMQKTAHMQLINDMYDKWGEYFEEAGDQSPLLMNHMLAKLLVAERQNNEYLRKCLNEISRRT